MIEYWNNWVKANYLKVLSISSAVFGFMWSVDSINAGYINPPQNRNAELRKVVANMPRVEYQLRSILDRYGAGRVVIFRVYSAYLDRDLGHEMPGSMTKTSIYSITADNSVTASGVSLCLSQLTRLPGALFAPVLDTIIGDPKTTVDIVTDELPDSGLKELFTKRDTVESLWVAIPNSKTDFAGILLIDWPHDLDSIEKVKIAQELPGYSRLLGKYL